MQQPPGPHPLLTPSGIRRVLRWRAQGASFLARHGTAYSFSQELGVSVHVLRRALRKLRKANRLQWSGRGHLDPARTRKVQRWLAAQLRFAATHLTATELAESLGVSTFVVFDCIRRNGVYAKRPGAGSAVTRRARKADDMSDPGSCDDGAVDTEVTRRGALLRHWPSARTAAGPTPRSTKKIHSTRGSRP
jgi:AraC-like DNA-binding protein